MKLKIFCITAILILVIPTVSAVNFSKTDDISPKKLLSNLDSSADIVNLITQVNESLVKNYLKNLTEIGPRYTGSENCKKAAQYIYNEFEKMGLDVYFDNWRYIRFKSQNVVATLNGTDPSSDAVFIICAHYDTITYPLYLPKKNYSVGADDDGSGVAGILAIASILCKYHFNHTIRFIAVSGEEVGNYGAYTYAKRAYERDENIVAVFDIDMIGYANTTKGGKTLKVFETPRTEWISSFSNNVSQKYKEYIDLIIKTCPNFPTDSQAFLDFGYDAVMYYESDDYPFTHTANDKIDNINFTYFVKTTKFLLAVTAELANKPIDVQVHIVTPCEGCFYLFDHKIFRLPGFNLWRTDLRGMTYIIGRNNKIRVNISTNDEIEDVYFYIDDDGIMLRDKKSPYECEIENFCKPTIGKHTISVKVTTASGKVAYDEMDIYIVNFSCFFFGIFPRRQI